MIKRTLPYSQVHPWNLEKGLASIAGSQDLLSDYIKTLIPYCAEKKKKINVRPLKKIDLSSRTYYVSKCEEKRNGKTSSSTTLQSRWAPCPPWISLNQPLLKFLCCSTQPMAIPGERQLIIIMFPAFSWVMNLS